MTGEGRVVPVFVLQPSAAISRLFHEASDSGRQRAIMGQVSLPLILNAAGSPIDGLGEDKRD